MLEKPSELFAKSRTPRNGNTGQVYSDEKAGEQRHPESIVSRNWDPSPNLCTLRRGGGGPAFSDSGRQRGGSANTLIDLS